MPAAPSMCAAMPTVDMTFYARNLYSSLRVTVSLFYYYGDLIHFVRNINSQRDSEMADCPASDVEPYSRARAVPPGSSRTR